jgi:hypothetical protein
MILAKFKYFGFGLLLLCVMGAMNACTEEVESEDDELVVDDDYYEFRSFNLKNYEIPAMISLPDETANIGASTKPEVEHIESDIKWAIRVGQNFELLIEDYADFTDLIEVKKKELAEQNFFRIKYIVDEKDLIVYERTLVVKGSEKAASTVGIEHKSYHVYGQKIVDGITYELQSRADGYEKHIIQLMAKSIKSFKPLKDK